MKSKDSKFLQAYIELDDICKQKLKSEKGITLYIEKMEQKRCDIEAAKTLKRLRYTRNKLVHEPDADISYTDSDIKWLIDFKIMVQEKKDPLSRSVSKSENNAQALKRRPLKADKAYSAKKRKQKNDLKNAKTVLLPFAVCIALVLLALIVLHFVK